MAKINWTDEAVRWLQDIRDYIAQDNPDAAFKVVRGIYDKIQSLRQFPEIGYLYAAKGDHNVRVLLHGHYRIAYVIKPGGQIDILGIFHDALDIDRYL